MERQKSSFLIGIALIMMAVLVSIGWIYWLQKGNWLGEKPCTQEAKLCPDGSAVGRTGPNCEFAACPLPGNCAKEGETIGAEGMPSVCCVGLKAVGGWPGGYNGDCSLPPPPTGLLICANCGNKICEINNGENKCNCPEDCANYITADWQTYRNEKYGFEFKYPPYLELSISTTSMAYVPPILGIGIPLEKDAGAGITIYNKDDFFKGYQDDLTKMIGDDLAELNKNFESFQPSSICLASRNEVDINEVDVGPCNDDMEKMLIGGVSALDYRYANVGGVGRDIYLLKNDKIILISHNKTYINKITNKASIIAYRDFDQILSTFKFI